MKINSRTTESFRRLLSKLPVDIRRAANESYKLFRNDPTHRSLNFKPLKGLPDLYSARISYGYRVVGRMRPDGIVWFWVGSHADYDRLLERS